MAKAPKLPHGRPSVYTDGIAATICERLAAGDTLRAICRADGMPSHTTVLDWTRVNAEFSDQYAKARESGYRLMADELLEIADDGVLDRVMDEESGRERVDHDVIARSRLRVDTRKWLLSKMLPKLYGDKIETTVKAVDENDIPMAPIEYARRIAFALSQGATPEQPAPPSDKATKQP